PGTRASDARAGEDRHGCPVMRPSQPAVGAPPTSRCHANGFVRAPATKNASPDALRHPPDALRSGAERHVVMTAVTSAGELGGAEEGFPGVSEAVIAGARMRRETDPTRAPLTLGTTAAQGAGPCSPKRGTQRVGTSASPTSWLATGLSTSSSSPAGCPT